MNWFQSYFSSRCQLVLCNVVLSSIKFIRHGVPQGSILGPLLFLLFINDLPNASKLLNFLLFADDTSILASHKSYDKLFQVVNLALAHVKNSYWFRANKLSLNVMKTNYMLFTSPVSKYQLLKAYLKYVVYRYQSFLQLNSLVFTLIVILLGISLSYRPNSIQSCKNVGILSRISHLLPIVVYVLIYIILYI